MARELDLYQIEETLPSLRENLVRLRSDYDNHIHDGTSSRTFQTLIAETVSARALAVRKFSFTDNTAGLWTGLVGNQPKFFLGDASQYFKFDQNGIAISVGSGGSLIITQSIGTLTLNSNGMIFKVDGFENARINLSSGTGSADPTGATLKFWAGDIDVALEFIYVSAGIGKLIPASGDTIDLGDATNFFNDINYKTLTDRGCLGWFDDGVILMDGRKVKDTEAIRSIQKHPSKSTIYGVPMLDYSTMPKAVYKPAPIADKDIYKGEGKDRKIRFYKGEKMGQDGAETTALISIMLGAIKELTDDRDDLRRRVAALEAK